jgi:hypothetical protein
MIMQIALLLDGSCILWLNKIEKLILLSLSREVEGMCPMKPGNQHLQMHGANSSRLCLKDEG